MSERFTKIRSNYTMRTKHQESDAGTIMERDWVTTNGLNVLRFGAGRRVWYNSGNFVFTTSNIPSYHKRHKLSSETKDWSWNDCKDADGTVNDVKPNTYTNDVRTYAYYGSSAELIRSTIEEIILDFPGRIVKTNYTFTEPEGTNYYYELKNDFNIDLHHISVVLGQYDNEFRFFSESFDKYCIKTKKDGAVKYENVVSFNVTGDTVDCVQDYEGKIVLDITIETTGDTYKIYGYIIGGNVAYCVEYEDFKDYELFSIQPQDEYIDEYFRGLSGFKGLLLRQDTKPLYSNNFKTPVEFQFTWFYPEKKYIWPSDDYCIDVSSMAFEMYYSSLIDLGLKMDELWTDNIYRSMTHESIKNFDWTYSRKYQDGEEQDNIDGGERMIKILRIFGRVFDDVKCYIDGIKSTKKITYDNIENCPEALMSDEVELKGVDVISTIGSEYEINETITEDFLNTQKYVTKDISWLTKPFISTHRKWYQTKNCTDIYPDVCDNEIMRRFAISFKRIMQTKGTQQAIDMLMSFFGFCRNPIAPSDKDDYFLEEEAFYTKKMIPYFQCVDGSDDEEKIDDNAQNDGDITSLVEEPEEKEVDGGTVDEVTEEDEIDNWVEKSNADFSNIQSRTKGELINEINLNKDLELLYYPTEFSGIPVKTVLLGSNNEPFVVPYYTQNLIYDGNLMFQGKGGWGKFIKKYDDDETDDCFDYSETLSYLHVVGTIGDLLSINPKTLNQYDIYYVVNLNNYTEYDENPPVSEYKMTVSHYFVLMNQYESNKFYSWKNVPTKPSTTDGFIEKVDKIVFENFYGDDEYADWFYDIDSLIEKKTQNVEEEGAQGMADEEETTTSYTPTDEEKKSVYSYVFKHIEYLESIMSSNVGNNPHVGYGKYDDGDEFLKYMEKPFKYSLDKKLINNLNYEQLADVIGYDDIRENRITDKIQIMGYTKDEYDYLVRHNNENGDENDIKKLWYINTKVLTITNNIKQRVVVNETFSVNIDGVEYSFTVEDDKPKPFIETDLYERLTDEDKAKCEKPNYFFNKYFKQVILPYLMQVIPSTTILKIKGF